MDEFLQKPVAFEKLKLIVNQRLKQTEDKLAGIDKQVLSEIYRLAVDSNIDVGDFFADYLADLPVMFDSIETAFNNNDLPAVARTMHALKGMHRTMWAMKLADIAEELEKAVCNCKDFSSYEQFLFYIESKKHLH